MLWVYLAALIVGLGTIAIQLAMAGHGGDVHDADAGGHDVHHAGDGDAAWAVILSVRFWTFALLAFGVSGSLLTAASLAGSTSTLVIAIVAGLLAGLGAGLTFRALRRSTATSSASLAQDAVGQLGRVLLPCGNGRVGKVRLQLKGQAVDVLAMTAGEEIAIGRRVIVEEIRGDIAQVVVAPDELAA